MSDTEDKRKKSIHAVAQGGPAVNSKEPELSEAEKRTLAARKSARGKQIRTRIYIAVAVVTVICAIIAAMTVFFKVSRIEVNGNKLYSDDYIVKMSGIQMGDNLLLMDKYAVIDKMLESLYFADSVVIRRVFPDKLEITVTEVTPSGVFANGDGSYWLCDSTGRLLEKRYARPEDAALVEGAELVKPSAGAVFRLTEEEKAEPLTELFGALESSGLTGRVSLINIEKIYDLRMEIEGYTVVFGNSGGLAGLCARLTALLDTLAEEGTLTATVDMSGDNIRVIR